MANILLIATGSVAVIKTKSLMNLLKKDNEVRVIVSDYVKNNFDEVDELNFENEETNLNTFPKHIEISKWADLIIVAPASTNTLSKFINGITDNFVMSTLMAARTKIIFVPAMNHYMWKALNERSIPSKIMGLDHMIIGPVYGKLREGEVGIGRMSEPKDIYESIKSYLINDKKLKVLLPYGASKIYIDPVRYITNGSTGTMASILSNKLRLSGMDVDMYDISKYSNAEFLDYAMHSDFDIYISPAAFSDFDVITSKEKIKKGSISDIHVKNNIDVIKTLISKKKDKKYYAFKLDASKSNAIKKMNDNNIDGILWNKINSFGNQKISGSFITKSNEINFENKTKDEVASIIVKSLIEEI